VSWFGFDVYGTLLDVASATSGAGLPDGFGAMWRATQLEYTWTHQLIGDYRDFWTLTAEALDVTIARTGAGAPQRDRLLERWLGLEPHPEAGDALRELRGRGARLAAISNGTPAMLASALAHAGLGELLDEVVSVDEIGVYKPDARVYRHAAERVGAPLGEITFVSAHAWDAAGARAAGMRVAAIARRGEPAEYGIAAGAADLWGLIR
jgi:2-haloacid dehalogenase